MLDLGERYALPVLVDAAAEENLRKTIQLGADLVTYSGGKAIGGPTVGFITGRRDLVSACELQNVGIARAMKVGKEQIMGLLAALGNYPPGTDDPAKLDELHRGLMGVGGFQVSLVQDLAGRDIQRVGLSCDSVDRLKTLVSHLREGDPGIYTRNHQIEEGLVLFDVREVAATDVSVIVEKVHEGIKSEPI
jgi:L-seryl-tRNA(Ser) seleniumtransferase/D-glucosaminate-6-phosphate ammonia-lyase